MSPRNRRTAAAASALTLVAAFLFWLSMAEPTTVFVPPSDAQPAPAAPARPLGPPEEYAEVAQRPLFSPRRLPPQPKPVPTTAAVAVAAPPPQLVLTAASVLGVAIGPDSKAAIVRLSSGATATIKEGEALNGWRLTQIAVDHVTFELDGTDKDIFFPAAKDNPSKAPRRVLSAAPRPR